MNTMTTNEMIEEVTHYAMKNPINRMREIFIMEDMLSYIRHNLSYFFQRKGIKGFGKEDLCMECYYMMLTKQLLIYGAQKKKWLNSSILWWLDKPFLHSRFVLSLPKGMKAKASWKAYVSGFTLDCYSVQSC